MFYVTITYHKTFDGKPFNTICVLPTEELVDKVIKEYTKEYFQVTFKAEEL